MQSLKKFSGSTVAPTKKSGFDFSAVSDGNIYKAIQGTDYSTHKGFLVALSRYANSNGFSVSRYVHPEGVAVEFQLTAKPVAEPVAESTEPTPEATEAF